MPSPSMGRQGLKMLRTVSRPRRPHCFPHRTDTIEEISATLSGDRPLLEPGLLCGLTGAEPGCESSVGSLPLSSSVVTLILLFLWEFESWTITFQLSDQLKKHLLLSLIY